MLSRLFSLSPRAIAMESPARGPLAIELVASESTRRASVTASGVCAASREASRRNGSRIRITSSSPS
jgi:hypothetical protein